MATSVPINSRVDGLNVPNALSTARLLLSIVVFVLVGRGWYWSALVAFAIAAGTDWVDGYWARKYGQVTKLGRVLDPFVDKVIICGAFISLVAVPAAGIAAWVAIVVVIRELLVTSLRSMVEASGGDFSAKALGKWKMVAQCAAVMLAMGSAAMVAATQVAGTQVAGTQVAGTQVAGTQVAGTQRRASDSASAAQSAGQGGAAGGMAGAEMTVTGATGAGAIDATVPAWLYWGLQAAVWGAVILTVLSGLEYVWIVIRMHRGSLGEATRA
jgi:CDP-diacylglycerol--glycerol-3-phosphate 3-phosphatidyltransferase